MQNAVIMLWQEKQKVEEENSTEVE
jgi:hypothetical protein